MVTEKTASKERLCTKRCSQIKCKKTKAFDPEKVQIRKKVKFKDKCINDLTIFKERGEIMKKRSLLGLGACRGCIPKPKIGANTFRLISIKKQFVNYL